MFLRKSMQTLLLATLFAAAPARGAGYQLSYGGRLVDKTGKALQGSVDLRVSFYRSETGDDVVPVQPLEFRGVTLKDGLFTLTLALDAGQFHQVFPSVGAPVYVAIENLTANISYPRRAYGMMPYAGKIPVDEKTAHFNGAGELTVGPETSPAPNQFLTKNSAGELVWASPSTTVASLQGNTISASTPTSGQALVYDGTQWRPQTVSAGSSLGYTPLNKAGDTLLGPLNMGSNALTVASPVAGTDAASKAYVDFGLALKQDVIAYTPVNKAGDTLTGSLNLGGHSLTNLAVPAAGTDAATKDYVDTTAGLLKKDGSVALTGNWALGGFDLTNAGRVRLGAQKDLGLGRFDNAQEATFILSLNATTDKGSTWFNTNTNQIKVWNGTAAVGLGVAGSGLQNLNGLTGNTQTLAVDTTGTSLAWDSAAAAHTLHIPLASATGVTAGLLSKSDYDSFAGKLSGTVAIANGGTNATTASGARTSLGAAASGANGDITSLTGLTTAITVAQGGTNATTASGARTSLGAAASGANSDITSLSGLTTALSVGQGGTGATSASGARSAISAASSGANSDITSLTGLTTALSVGQGGTGATSASGARSAISAASSGANSDITSLTGLTTALSVGQGGTGLTSTPANGKIAIGNGSGYSLANLTAGTGISISNAAGAVTINATGDASAKVDKAGDSMTGALNLPTDGLVAGTSQLVLAGGKVGIGTASPSSLLQVGAATSSAAKMMSMKSSTSGADWGFWLGNETISYLYVGGMANASQYFWRANWNDLAVAANTFKSASDTASQTVVDVRGATSQSGDYLRVSTSAGAGDVLKVNASGNVGIGTATPASKLHVNSGEVTGAPTLASGTVLTTAGSFYDTATANGQTAASGMAFSLFKRGDVDAANTVTIPAAYTLLLNGAPRATFTADITESAGLYVQSANVSAGSAVVAKSYGAYFNAQSGATNNYAAAFMGGNVGIGTATPGHPLEVQGTTPADGILSLLKSSSDYPTALQIQNSAAAWQFSARNSSDANPGGFNFYYSANGSTGWTSPLSITTSGRVGIGTTSPQGALDVAGTICFAGANCRSSWPASTDLTVPGPIGASTPSSGKFTSLSTVSTSTATSGSTSAVAITPTYNQASGTAANTDLLINRTQTAVGSGAQLLLDAQVGGATKFNVSNAGDGYFAGKIGIGMSSPTGKLDVSGGYVNVINAEAGADTLRVGAVNGIAGLYSSGKMAVRADNGLSFAGGSREMDHEADLFISSAGVVGVGTRSPQAPLHIAANAAGPYDAVRVSSAATPASYFLTVGQTDGASTVTATNSDLVLTAGGRISNQASGGGWANAYSFGTTSPMAYAASSANFLGATTTWAPSSGSGSFHFFELVPIINQTGTASGDYTGIFMNVFENSALGTNKYLMDLQTNGSSKFSVKSNGNVGIGTATPTAPLDVAGTAKATTFVGPGGLTGSFSMGMRESGVQGAFIDVYGKDYATNSHFGGIAMVSDTRNADASAGRFDLYQYDGSNYYQRLTVAKNGNVGISEGSPTAKLQVAGQIVSTMPSALAPSGTTQTVDFTTGNLQVLNLGGAGGTVTLSFANAVAGGSYAVKIAQGATPRSVVWPAAVKWPNGAAMTVTNAANAVDLVTFVYDGANYLAIFGNNYQ